MTIKKSDMYTCCAHHCLHTVYVEEETLFDCSPFMLPLSRPANIFQYS